MALQSARSATRSGLHRWAWSGVVVALAAAMLAPGGSAGASAVRGPSPAAISTYEQVRAGEPIPLTPLSGLTSLDATVDITVDGTVNGKPTQGDLTATLTSNDQGVSQIDVTGSLLGDIVAQVGGSAVKLFRPNKVSIYSLPDDGPYVVVSGFFDVCVKPDDSLATQALEQLSPQGLMTILTASDVARGTFVGDETLDGIPVKHYLISGETFLAAAQASTDPTVSSFSQALETAADSDLYVATDTGYPVAYRGAFGGSFAPLQFEGDLTVDIRLTGLDSNTPVSVPGSCDHPI